MTKTKTKVSLINSRIGSATSPPLGLLYIAAVLRNNGFRVQAFDPEENDKTFMNKVVKFQPKVIGISFLTSEYIRAQHIIKTLKDELPETLIVAGGVHASSLPDETLNQLPVDAVVIGEGEYAILEICRRIESRKTLKGVNGVFYKSGRGIIKNPARPLIEDLDLLPFPARDLLDFEWYLTPPGFIRGKYLKSSATIISSRGCPYYCIYCSSNIVFGYKFRQRSPKNVVNEMEYLIEKYGVDGFSFVDDTFTINPRWVHAFCQELKKRGINLPWVCNTRVNTINKEMLMEMKEAGCVQLDFGVESGSDRILKVIKKGTSVKQIIKAFDLAKELGLRRQASFMVGLPTETREDIEKTITLAKRINPDFVVASITTPHPGSNLYEDAVKEGWINKTKFDRRWQQNTIGYPPIMNINLSKEELIHYRNRIANIFWKQNYIAYLLNLKFMMKVIFTLTKHPIKTLKAFRLFLKSGTISNFVDIIKNLHRHEMRKERRQSR